MPANLLNFLCPCFLPDPACCSKVVCLESHASCKEDVDSAISKMTMDFYKTYKKNPGITSIPMMIRDALATKTIRGDLLSDIKKRIVELLKSDVSDVVYVTNKVAEFAKHRALEEAVLQSAMALEKGDYTKIDKLISAAMDVGLNDDGGIYNYWNEIENRTDHRVALKAGIIKPDGITTGHEELDKVLYHMGWGRGELSVLMGPPKAGKSMSLVEFGKNASLAGYNVFYATLEVSARITSDRADANLSDTMFSQLKDTPNVIKGKIDTLSKGAGIWDIVEFPSGTMKVSDLRRLLERQRAKGIIYDMVIVDYADIMAPEKFTGDRIEDMRNIYLDLRAISQRNKVAMLTATQTNRNGASSAVAKMTDIAEDFNKVRTADLLISLNATEEEVKTGEARLYFAAMRNSESGFTLRIKQDRSRMRFLIKVLNRE